MKSEGIDKIAIATKDFLVLPNHHLTIQPSAYQPNAPEPKEETLLFNTQKGQKAYFNHSAFNLTIKPYGLGIQFNPSIQLHPYNLTNNDNEIQQIWDFIRDEVKEAGILLPPDNELKIKRLDVAINQQMKQPISLYSFLWKTLRGKYMNTKQYPESHYFENDSRQINFYDKTSEVALREEVIPIDPRMMRGEFRALKGKSVETIYKLNDLSTLLKVGGEYRIEKYKSTLANTIFADGNRDEQLQIFIVDYDREVEVLRQLRKSKARGGLGEWAEIDGLENKLERFGDIKLIQKAIIDAGYSKSFTYQYMKEYQIKRHRNSFLQTQNQEINITKMYHEVFTKFAV
jgi:hypothetical protein